MSRRPLGVGIATLLVAATCVAVPSTASGSPGNGQGQSGDVTATFLGINDFHGAIDPPTGSGGTVNGTPAGGVEYLATKVKQLRAAAQAAGRKVITVGAGDLIGGSPLVSAAFHDEPSIEEMNALGLDLSSVGNHEFDEGVTELLRMQNGGCHPTDGCQDGDDFAGASFQYLAANVVYKSSGKTIFPATAVRGIGGVQVGFVGMTLHDTPSIVNPAGVASVNFTDEITTANAYAAKMKAKGVNALVLLLHQGGTQVPANSDPSSCVNFVGDVAPIVAGLDPAYGVVMSGHTHQWYNCTLPNSGGTSVVTSAGSVGRLVTDVDVSLSRQTGKFTSISAHNVLVDRGTIDPTAKAIADKYRTAVAPIANAVVGSITADITRTPSPAGESALGDVIADAQLARTQSANAQIAFMNPGGIRADLVFANSAGGEAPGQLTFGECFTVQPFNNLVVTQTYTGAQIKDVLEQQFPGYAGQTTNIFLQVSAGFSYSYDTTRALGDRILNMTLNGVPIDPAATYRVSATDFLVGGGDRFTNLKVGTNRVTQPGFDVDALTAYIAANSPVAPGPRNRYTKIA